MDNQNQINMDKITNNHNKVQGENLCYSNFWSIEKNY